jgi:hypothetical protein
LKYSDQLNVTTLLSHKEAYRDCPWQETLRPLAYVIMTTPQLRSAFLHSPLSAGYTGGNDGVTLQTWFSSRELKDPVHGLMNLLNLVEFIISLRGEPVVNPHFHPF